MLNGLQPVIIFQLSTLAPTLGEALSKIPVISSVPDLIARPPIPLYLNDEFTQLVIISEDKNIDIDTEIETLSNGQEPEVNQKGVGNFVKIQMVGLKDSIPVTLLSAMMDQIFDKVTSKEYSISYFSGAVTIFNAVLKNFSVSQNADSTKLDISFELSKGSKQPSKKPAPIEVQGQTGTFPGG